MKGTIELDANGDLISANFPLFALQNDDKASLKAERGPDGTLRVTMRGDVYDGRGFLKASMTGQSDTRRKASFDLDLDIKVGAIAGYHGEPMRNFELRLSRRAGEIRSFAFNAKLRDSAIIGDLRGSGGRPVLVLQTGDAGALFRFTDMYPRMVGGTLQMTIEPPTADHAPQNGILDIRQFSVRGEAALDRIAATPQANDPGPRRPSAQGVEFTRMQIDFRRAPGRIDIREGYVWGMAVGASMDGQIDFTRDDVRLRGTLVPGYALNNLPAQMLPIVGTLLTGGKNGGVFGMTYEVVGPPSDMILRVNPMSLIAPGFLRKLFEFRGNDDRRLMGGDPAR